MTQVIKVLLIEDNRIEAFQTQHWLKKRESGGFEIWWVELLSAGLELAATGGIDIVLLDLNLPDSQGMETFTKFHRLAPDIPVVVLTGESDDTMGPLAVKNGAQDFLVKKDADCNSLAHVLRFAYERHRSQMEQLSKENSRRQAEMAREVQLRMLPRFRPEVQGYNFWDFYKAADHVGGDYFSYCQLPDQRIAICIADICGKGISAALTMAELCSEVRHCLQASGTADLTLTQLNRVFCDRNTFITFTLCILDPLKHTLSVANAGHMPPLRRQAESRRVAPLPLIRGGLPLGIDPETTYKAEVFDILPGDLFLMYTDGITEVFGISKELYGQRNLKESVGQASADAEHTILNLIQDVESFRGRKTQSDDICVVSFARGNSPKHDVSLSTLPSSPRQMFDPSTWRLGDCLEGHCARSAGGSVHGIDSDAPAPQLTFENTSCGLSKQS